MSPTLDLIAKPYSGPLAPPPPRLLPRVSKAVALVLIYLLLAVMIAGLWTYEAKTEKGTTTEIVKLADGTAQHPFVGRRLLPDAARTLAHAVPQHYWDACSNAIDQNPRLSSLVRQDLGWNRPFDPLLLSATLLIGLSILTFMIATWMMVDLLYFVRPWLGHAIVGVLTIGLLGGRGPSASNWGLYPYDLPQAALFLACMCCILRKNWLAIPLYLAAVYNKETSLILVAAFVLLWPGSLRMRWLLGAAMLLAGGGIRFGISKTYTSAAFQLPLYPVLANFPRIFIFGIWRLPLWVLAILAIKRNWTILPQPLKKLTFVPLVLLGAIWCTGWPHELRAYMEAYPIMALLFLQVCMRELKLGEYLTTREKYLSGNAPRVN